MAGTAREQGNPGVRGKVGIANPSGSIVLLHDPRHPATSTLRHRRALLLANLVREFTFRLFFSTTKVCPDSLNLLDAGDSFAEILSLTSYYLFSQARDLIVLF
jgi:hypothetical protein